MIGFVVGFPVTMFLSWSFDLTSDGLQRETVSSRRGKASIFASMLLLVAGTAGLFFLIRPSLQTGAAAPGVIAVTPNSVAVLPFESSGEDPKDAWLIEGLSDELRDQLGQVIELDEDDIKWARPEAENLMLGTIKQSLAILLDPYKILGRLKQQDSAQDLDKVML